MFNIPVGVFTVMSCVLAPVFSEALDTWPVTVVVPWLVAVFVFVESNPVVGL